MIGLALLDALEGAAVSAARRLDAVAAIMVLAGMNMPIHYQARIDQATALAKDALGAEAFATAWATGRASPGAVIAAALGQPDPIRTPTIGVSATSERRLSARVKGASAVD